VYHNYLVGGGLVPLKPENITGTNTMYYRGAFFVRLQENTRRTIVICYRTLCRLPGSCSVIFVSLWVMTSAIAEVMN